MVRIGRFRIQSSCDVDDSLHLSLSGIKVVMIVKDALDSESCEVGDSLDLLLSNIMIAKDAFK